MLCFYDYRRYILDIVKKNSEWEDIILDVSEWVQEYLLPFCRNVNESIVTENIVQEKRHLLNYINHPLVNSGNAYWINDTTLCLGYKLKNNHSIFRPIFSYKRQDLINNFQKDISKIVLKRKKCMNYIEFYRIKKIPKDVLDYIFEFY